MGGKLKVSQKELGWEDGIGFIWLKTVSQEDSACEVM
jgi:hypothetical protein